MDCTWNIEVSTRWCQINSLYNLWPIRFWPIWLWLILIFRVADKVFCCGRYYLAVANTVAPHWAKMAQTDHVTIWPLPLTLEVMAPVADAGRHSIRIPSLKFVGLAVWKIWRTMCVTINGPGDVDFWPWNWCASRIKGGKPSLQMWAC